MCRRQSVFGGLAVLRHHDDRRLNGGQHRQEQVEQDVRVRIETARQHDGVQNYPNNKDCGEYHQERPRAAEACHLVGQPFAKRIASVRLDINVAGNRKPLCHPLDNSALRRGNFLMAQVKDALGEKLNRIMGFVVHGISFRLSVPL